MGISNDASMNRRRFLRTGLAGSAALAVVGAADSTVAATSNVKKPCDPWHGLKMGLTSYTLRKFTLDQAIAMTKEAGVKYISLKDVHLPYKSTKAQREEAHAKVEAAGLTLMGGGVIYMKNSEPEIRSYFEYARDAGMGTVVCSPVVEAFDIVESMAKEFDLRVAIHNHGPGDKLPSPLDVLRLVQKRDARMGICLDVGHSVRAGDVPAPTIRKCARRLYEFHIKDITAATPKGAGTEVGSGVIDIVSVLRTLLDIKYAYHVALEYEAHGDNPMPGVIESLAYMRGVLAALP
jgi:sugar phosphate isomerase/epimerase